MGDNVVVIALACSDCKRRNYSTKKNKQTHKEKIELKKYCRWCKHHTLHKETK
ncbi:MAG: 50S ribosomal protein L33 [Ignavibacteriales bacterium]|jgi:large subunit ribosomal protein L33